MNLNTHIKFNFSGKKQPSLLMLTNLLLVTSLSVFLLTFTLTIGFVIRISHPETPDQTTGLLNLPMIQKATSLLKEQTVNFVPDRQPQPSVTNQDQ